MNRSNDTDMYDDDVWIAKTLASIRSNQNTLFASAMIACKYYMTYLDKNDDRTPAQSGFGSE